MEKEYNFVAYLWMEENKMKYVFITILAIVFIAIIEALIYLTFAFCCWDLNWPPNSDGFARFGFALFSLVGVFLGIGFSINIIDD